MTQSSTAASLHDASTERLRLWLRMLKTSRMIEATLREKFRIEFNATLPRFDVMAALSRYNEGLKMSQLSSVLRVSNGNVTGIVDRLADDGLLVRVPVPGDRRASLVRLTRRGHEEFALQAAAHKGWVDELLQEFGAEDAQTLSERLQSLSDNLSEDQP